MNADITSLRAAAEYLRKEAERDQWAEAIEEIIAELDPPPCPFCGGSGWANEDDLDECVSCWGTGRLES